MVVSAGAEWGGDLHMGLLGPLTATRQGKAIALRGPKRRALLAMLALQPGRVVSIETLVEDLWDGRPPRQARATLQSHVSHLRRDLGGARGPIVATATGYRLDVERLAVDIGEFDRTFDSAMAQHAPRAIADGLGRALAIWRGPALADFTTAAWAAPEIARLEARRDLAIETRAEAHLALGGHTAVLAELQQLVSIEPLRESRWLLLMAALQRAGRHVEAVRAAHRYRMVLREAGLGPSPVFEQAEQAVVGHEPVELRLPSPPPALPPPPPRPVSVRPAPSAPPEGPGSRRLPLVGRRPELAALTGALAAAASGRPGLVLVSGEPGIGKSHLVGELAGQARGGGATVLVGHCDDGLAVPYQPFVEVLQAFVDREASDPTSLEAMLGEHPEHLAQLVPDVLRLLPHREQATAREPDIERYHMFESVCSWLATLAAGQQVLLVLEDVHFATRPTLLLLRHVLRSLGDERLCIVATLRETEIEPRSDCESLLIDISRHPRTSEVTLSGLPGPEIADLIGSLWGAPGERPVPVGTDFAADLSLATAGNPFFVVEVLRHIDESLGRSPGRGPEPAGGLVPMPPSVQEVVRQRLGRLSTSTEEILVRAAILGREFSARVLIEMSRLDASVVASSLEDACRAGFVEPVPGADLTYQFCHLLVRDVLVTAQSDVRRALLHRDAGLALEALAPEPGTAVVVELARHFSQAAAIGEEERAARYSRRAGDHALARHAAEEAVMHYSAALRHHDRSGTGDAHDRCDLLMDLAEAQRRLPDPGHRETFLDAARAAVELGNQDHLARAAKGIARGFLLADTADEERMEVIETAVASFGDRIDATRARLLASLAGELRLAGRHVESEDAMEEAVVMARLAGDLSTTTITQLMQWDLMWHPATFEARRAMEARLVGWAAELDDEQLLTRIAAVRLVHALEAGRGRLADQRLRDVERHGAATGGPAMAWFVPLVRSVVAVAAGRLDDAERAVATAVEASQADGRRGIDTAVLGQQILLSHLRGEIGRWEPMIAAVAEHLPVARALLGLVCCEAGRTDEARAVLDELVVGSEVRVPHDLTWPVAMVALAEVCERLVAARPAAVLFDRLVPYRDRFAATYFFFSGPFSHALGRLAAAQGDLAAADRWFAEAEHRCAAFPSPLFQQRAAAARSAIRVGS